MIDHSAEFRRCLIDIDIPAIRKLWGHVAPHLPQPKTEHEALTTIHMARTQMNAVPMQMRAYSHRWLLDHVYPSQLPDELKPSAERLYPKISDAVGISVNSRSIDLKPVADMVREAMEGAVQEAVADRLNLNDPLVKRMMTWARARVLKKLIGV